MREMLLAIYRYQGFIKSTIKRDFQSRYQRSMLGILWLFLQPLAMILVYTLIFANIMKAKLPGVEGMFSYSIYLCAGVLTWGLFTEILGRSTNVFLENANLLKKVSFPRICLPVIVTTSALVNFIIIFGLFSLFLIVSFNFPGFVYLSIIPVLLVLIIFASSFGIVLGVLNVFFRDVGQLVNVILQFWFWLTPIVYPTSILPQWAHDILALNPMLSIIQAMQLILVQHQVPSIVSLLYPLLLGGALFLLGMYLFRGHVGEMVDEL